MTLCMNVAGENVSMIQLQQINKTSIIWSGCGTYSYCHPLRIIVYLGDLKVAALVDTGSDYDAIDKDLSLLQSDMECMDLHKI